MLFCVMGNSGIGKREIVNGLKEASFIRHIPVVTDTDNRYADNYIGKEEFDKLESESKLIAFRQYSDGARTAILKENLLIALNDDTNHYITICTPRQFTGIYDFLSIEHRKKLRPVVIDIEDENQRLINILTRNRNNNRMCWMDNRENGADQLKTTIHNFYNDKNHIDTKVVNEYFYFDSPDIDYSLWYMCTMIRDDALEYLKANDYNGLDEEDVESYRKENETIEELMTNPKNLKGIYDKY